MRKKQKNKKQQNRKKQQISKKQQKKKAGFMVRIALVLGVIAMLGVIILLVSLAAYGLVHLRRGEPVYIENVQDISSRQVAIVPGAGFYDGAMTSKAKDRLQAALQLYEAGKVEQIVVSGDGEETIPMTRYLLQKGVPKEVIGSDEHGVDTYETLARTKEKYGNVTYYICTQKLYTSRVTYLMNRLDMDGVVVCADTMYYREAGKSWIREYFAAGKAVADPLLHRKKPKMSVAKKDFIQVEPVEQNSHLIQAEDVEQPEDYEVVDRNPNDDYDVEKAVEYATTYALTHNPEYPVFEQNCTNFVSQCLVAGGITMQGEGEISEKKRYAIGNGTNDWYSLSEKAQDGLTHYSTTSNFVNTNAFIAYFTEKRGYDMTIYQNDYQGKLDCLREIASGDVLVFFGEKGEVVHIGLVTGIGEWNAYFCGNTNNRRDHGAFRTDETEYAQFGVVHMSGKVRDGEQ